MVYFWFYFIYCSRSNWDRSVRTLLFIIERIIGKQYKEHSVATVAAWIHLILMNMGTTASMSMLMFAGYIGGAAMLPISVGGRALNPGYT